MVKVEVESLFWSDSRDYTSRLTFQKRNLGGAREWSLGALKKKKKPNTNKGACTQTKTESCAQPRSSSFHKPPTPTPQAWLEKVYFQTREMSVWLGGTEFNTTEGAGSAKLDWRRLLPTRITAPESECCLHFLRVSWVQNMKLNYTAKAMLATCRWPHLKQNNSPKKERGGRDGEKKAKRERERKERGKVGWKERMLSSYRTGQKRIMRKSEWKARIEGVSGPEAEV